MIVVYTIDEERITCPGATRYKTDEHNNLEVLGGRQGEDPAAVFADGQWKRVVIEEVDDETEDQMELCGVEENPVWGR